MNSAALTRWRQEAYDGGGATGWQYVMLSREQSRMILGRIMGCERPLKTLAVWEAARSYADWNTGRITVSVGVLADAARTTDNEVYRALSQLVELGAMVRTGRGRYALNPDVAWFGTRTGRGIAAVDLAPAE